MDYLQPQAQGVMTVTDEEYKVEYDKAAAELEAAAQATTARGPDGKFVKAEAAASAVAPAPAPEPAAEAPAPAAPPAVDEAAAPAPDPLADIRAKLEKTEKALQDTKAWGTKTSQELALLKREAEERKRQSERPAILDANPELEQAIKYVVPAPKPDEEKQRVQAWQSVIEIVHPGIFDVSIDPELEKAIHARFDALNGAQTDPLIAIREITAEKLAFAERQASKRFAAETQKATQKSAMSVPGAGANGAHKAPVDTDQEAVNRIRNMSSAEFERERMRVLKLI